MSSRRVARTRKTTAVARKQLQSVDRSTPKRWIWASLDVCTLSRLMSQLNLLQSIEVFSIHPRLTTPYYYLKVLVLSS